MASPASTTTTTSSSSPATTTNRTLHGPTPSFRAFRDTYTDVAAVQDDLRRAGLEACNLILGIDMTKSNETNGRNSFAFPNLHHISPPDAGVSNPYESAISIIGNTLARFDEDNLIPAYMFGCNKSKDRDLTCLKPGDASCNGFAEVLQRYRELAPATILSGPTTFGPLIRHACEIVKKNNGQYHILCIIADGEITRGEPPEGERFSHWEKDTIEAIVDASKLALSIIAIGVGDGPWEQMEHFDDEIPERDFDNFQFVPLNATLAKALGRIPSGATPDVVKSTLDATFALHALMETPAQYKEITKRKLMSDEACARATIRGKAVRIHNPPVPVPVVVVAAPSAPAPAAAVPVAPTVPAAATTTTTTTTTSSSHGASGAGAGGLPPPPPPRTAATPAAPETEICSICLERPLNTAYQCGHRFCSVCAAIMSNCPFCKKPVQNRIRLY